jgi:predicted nuclease of predicted toxin-antitoxin system
MSRPRFLADHDLNEHIVSGVLRREPALEWVRARDIGMSERADAEVLAYAADHGFLVHCHDEIFR